MSKVLQEIGFGSLPSSTKANLRDQVKSISTTIKADSYLIRRIRSSQYTVSTGQNLTLMYETRQTTIPFPSHLNGYYCEVKKGSYGPQFSEAYSKALHINNSIPRKEKDPGSFTLPCFINNACFDNALVELGASISVMPLSTYLNLGLGELAHTKLTVELADMTMKYPKGIAKNVLVDRMELDLESRLMGETLVINRSLDHFNRDYIELNDLNEPLELRRNQGNDLMPTIEEGEFHNSIMKDNMVYKGNNVIGALMNVSIFVGTFSVVTDFIVLEDMDAYCDKGMGDRKVYDFPKCGSHHIRGLIDHTNDNVQDPTITEVSDEDKIMEARSYQNYHRGPRESNIDEYWWRIYKSGDLEVLES
ncbi:mitochondrial proton/calcium exchanger protein-like protein isoform X1 [Tanacetum coccineum]